MGIDEAAARNGGPSRLGARARDFGSDLRRRLLLVGRGLKEVAVRLVDDVLAVLGRHHTAG